MEKDKDFYNPVGYRDKLFQASCAAMQALIGRPNYLINGMPIEAIQIPAVSVKIARALLAELEEEEGN